MMNSSQVLLHFLQSLGPLEYVFIFAVACAEAIAFVGFFVPGMTIIVLMAGLAANGYLSPWALLILAIAGAFVGDAVSYHFGKMSKDFLKRSLKLRKHIERAEPLFHKYGWVSIGIGRFTSPVRGVLPLVAGIGGMRRRAFYIANAFFASAWGIASVATGYFLGSASRIFLREFHQTEWIAVEGVALIIIVWFWIRERRKKGGLRLFGARLSASSGRLNK
ncbi:MAG: DedA family protein [Candidatus Peregrinibacteria bacterium]